MIPTDTYHPVQAVIVYHSNSSNEYYLETHSVSTNQAGKARFGAGQPLTKSALESMSACLAETFTSKIRFQGPIPRNVLYVGPENAGVQLMWFVPSERKHLFFSKNLHIPAGEAAVPSLVFVVCGSQLRVYATKSRKRPDAATKLYRAPFHNVGDGGIVCMGTAQKADQQTEYYEDLMAQWERSWWLSEFSETHGTPANCNINSLWQMQISTGSAFPAKQLIPSKYETIAKLIANL